MTHGVPVRAVLVIGPTATGKSELAAGIASAFGGEIISVDSCAVYRGMDIGSAKPDSARRNAVTHHLLNIREPDEQYDAGVFVRDAERCVAQIAARGALPVLCGGTMLYVKSLLGGLACIPEAGPRACACAAEVVARRGSHAAHAMLAKIDPLSAAKLQPADSQRIARALSVRFGTGRPLSEWLTGPSRKLRGCKVLSVVLLPADRCELGRRIALRVERMFAAGLVAEVAMLIAKHGHGIVALRAVGYRQVCAHLRNECDLLTAKALVRRATRQLAKRQLSWLRRYAVQPCMAVDPFPELPLARIYCAIRRFLAAH